MCLTLLGVRYVLPDQREVAALQVNLQKDQDQRSIKELSTTIGDLRASHIQHIHSIERVHRAQDAAATHRADGLRLVNEDVTRSKDNTILSLSGQVQALRQASKWFTSVGSLGYLLFAVRYSTVSRDGSA